MKILIQIGGGAHRFERMGLARAFQYSGHEVVLWNPEGKSPYDQIDEFTPDLFIGNGFELSEALINILLENPNIKCWLKLGDYGNIQYDLTKYNILVATDKEKSNIERLTKKLKVWGGAHYWAGRIDTHEKWKEFGVTPLHSTLGADIFSYTNGKELDEYKCDVGIISGYWPYKARVIDRWLLPLMNPSSNLNIKVFGYNWGTPFYCGSIDEEVEKHTLRSQSISLNLHEPHALDESLGFELNERTFKLLSNKCFMISDNPKDLCTKIFNGEIVSASNPEEFKSLIEYYLRPAQFEEKEELRERGYQKVIKSETYFHRCAYLMKNIFGDNEEKKILDSYEKAKEELL